MLQLTPSSPPLPCCAPPLLRQNAQRLAAGAQLAQTLTTPVVSVATPSLLAQGMPFSAMPTAYNTGELEQTKGGQTCTHAYTITHSPSWKPLASPPWPTVLFVFLLCWNMFWLDHSIWHSKRFSRIFHQLTSNVIQIGRFPLTSHLSCLPSFLLSFSLSCFLSCFLAFFLSCFLAFLLSFSLSCLLSFTQNTSWRVLTSRLCMPWPHLAVCCPLTWPGNSRLFPSNNHNNSSSSNNSSNSSSSWVLRHSATLCKLNVIAHLFFLLAGCFIIITTVICHPWPVHS